MDTLAIIDLETTGLDPATGHPVEVAIGLWSVEFRALIRCRSWLVAAPAAEVEKTVAVHGIPPALVAARGVPFEDVAKQVYAIVTKEAQAFVAYNANFDRAWLPAPVQNVAPWICACNDITWPRPSSSRSLLAVAHAHGVQVGALHRASDDVLLIARLLERCVELGADVDAMLARAMRPKGTFVVADTNFDEARNALAKEHGFRFDRPTKTWVRRLAREDVAALPFATREVTV